MELDIVLLQETIVSGNKVWESLNYILKDWAMFILDSKGLFSGFCSSWNPYKAWFNAYQSSSSIALDGKFQRCSHEVKIINCYGPYSQRTEFWKQILEDGFLSPYVIIGGDFNLTLSNRET